MTFEDVDTGEYRGNPYTQDISKAKDNRTFQQSPMMRIEHEDPGLHYIGESLPKPGDNEATWAGRETFVGVSPIPARADHSHDSFLDYGNYNTVTPRDCGAGLTLITLDYASGQDFRVSGSLLLLPKTGIWLISYLVYAERQTVPSTFTAGAHSEIRNYYLNGTFFRRSWRDVVAGADSFVGGGFTDVIRYAPSNIGVDSTVELAYGHNEVGNTHKVSIQQLTVIRLAEI